MGKRLYVGNLSYHTTEDGLRTAFTGSVSARVITDRESGRSRGFGFVEYGTEEEAMRAIEVWDGQELDGRNIRVNEAEDKPPRRGGGGGGRGSYDGGSGGGGGGGRNGGGGRGKKSRRRRRDSHDYD